MTRMIGIDFGTASSRVAVIESGVPQIILNKQGEPATPSTIGFSDDGKLLVGEAARRHGLIHPRDTVFGVKRLIGRKYGSPEVEWTRSFLPYELVDANGDVHLRVGSTVRSPTEIASRTLRNLKESAEEYLGEAVEEAIIAVPSCFSHVQREAIADAGRIAGLKVPRLIDEATAAALTYGLENMGRSGQFVAVIDLGAGFLNLAILEMADGLFQVLSVGGDGQLGGEDFDHRIVDWITVHLEHDAGIKLERDRTTIPRLKEAAERAKRSLSTVRKAEIELPDGAADVGRGQFEVVLTRQEYEKITDDLLERAVECWRRCLADASSSRKEACGLELRAEHFDEVLLLGGQTRDPSLREAVRRVFGRTPKRAVHEGVVAMGAAIQAGIIQGQIKDCVLLDVIPHTLGIEAMDGMFTPLIERNSTIPARKSRLFSPGALDQGRFEVHVLEGEGKTAADNLSLARLELANLPPAPLGARQIEVTFEIDVNGIVSVSAQDQATGHSQNVVIHSSGGLSQSEATLLATETRAREDKARKDPESALRQPEHEARARRPS